MTLKLRISSLVLAALAAAPSLPAGELDIEAVLQQDATITASLRDEATSFEDTSGYGYTIVEGQAAIDADTTAVFCPAAGTVIVHVDDVDSAIESLAATDNGNGTWNIPDPDTGANVTAKVQIASVVNVDIPFPLCAIPVVSAKQVKAAAITPVPLNWGACKRIRRCYQCGVQGACPGGGCISGFYTWSQLKNHLLCKYTGNWRDKCLEFLHPFCRLKRWKCQVCTGGIVQSRNYNR